MWWTSDGKRVLRGAEWNLFRMGLSTLWDAIEMTDDAEEEAGTTEVRGFDCHTKRECLALLAQVARGLHDKREPCSDLTVLTDATIAAVFAHIRYLIGAEIDSETDGEFAEGKHSVTGIRELVLAAIHQVSPDREGPLPESRCADQREWFDLVEYLMDLILDDRDYLAGDLFLDSDPDHSGALKALLGIPNDYFSAIPVDPTPEELEVIRGDLRRICGRPWAWGPITVCVIEDAYYGLLVGLCDEAAADREENACPLVYKLYATAEEGFDCTYAEWRRRFRRTVHKASARQEESKMLSPTQLEDTAQAALTGEAIPQIDGCRIERRSQGWVIAGRSGLFLFELERLIWSNDEPLIFDSPMTAQAAYLRALEYEEGRKKRYRKLMARWGRPLRASACYDSTQVSIGIDK